MCPFKSANKAKVMDCKDGNRAFGMLKWHTDLCHTAQADIRLKNEGG